jgi:hypothetical protein
MKQSGSQSKTSAKKPKRVSPRKELAVVTFAAVASIAGIGGLLGVHQPLSQVAQPPPQQPAASWSSSLHASHSTASHTVSQGSKAQVVQPAQKVASASWSPSSRGSHSTASHTVSQGSKAVASTGQTTNATLRSSRAFERDAQGGEDS